MNTPSQPGADAGAPDASLWTRKLAALLHDPPEKAYDFGPHHVHRAETHAASFGVSDVWKSLTGQPDWSAAAADRFVFPSGTRLCANLGEKQRPCFIHPMKHAPDTIDSPAASRFNPCPSTSRDVPPTLRFP